MNTGGLVERIDGAAMPNSDVTPGVARQLDDVARALRAVTDQNARTMRIKEAKKNIRRVPDPDAEPELPQILQHPPLVTASSSPANERSRGGIMAPAILALATIGVGVLMSASLTDISGLPGLTWLQEKPLPRLSTAVSLHAEPIRFGEVQAELDAPAQTEKPAETETATSHTTSGATPPISLDELALLEQCEGMIAAGDMPGARQTLALAASHGSVNARFALAETFDPNVLAAWGMRDPIADVSSARALYEQAMTAGDPRAAARIAALGSDSK